MKSRRFSEEQIIRILHEAERGELHISDICRKHGVSEQSFYRWRSKHGGMEVSDARKLKELEGENSRLKRLLAERDIEVDAMKELLSKKWQAHRIGGWRSSFCGIVESRSGEMLCAGRNEKVPFLLQTSSEAE